MPKNDSLANKSLSELQKLSEKFSKLSKTYGQKKAEVDAAITGIEKINALRAKLAPLAAKLQGPHNFIFLIDGSGSMTFPEQNGTSPLKTAIASTICVPRTSLVGFFGDRNPIWQPEIKIVGNQVVLPSWLGTTGTDLAPALIEAGTIALEAAGTNHFILVSDGDVFDAKDSLDALTRTLGAHESATLDIVIIGQPNARHTPMETFGQQLQETFHSRVSIKRADMQANAIFDSIVADRTKAKSQRKPRAPKA